MICRDDTRRALERIRMSPSVRARVLLIDYICIFCTKEHNRQ